MRFASVFAACLAASCVTALGELGDAAAQPPASQPATDIRVFVQQGAVPEPRSAASYGQVRQLASARSLGPPEVSSDLNAWIDAIGRSEPVRRLVSFLTGDAPPWRPYAGALLAGLLVLGAIWLLWQPPRVRASVLRQEVAEEPADQPSPRKSVPVNESLVRPPAFAAGARAQVAGQDEAPSWFDELGFLERSQTHFLRLQAAWDHADYRALHQCSTPQFSSHLQRERRRLQGHCYTEVVSLNAELVSIQRQDDLAVTDVLFTGEVREGEQGLTEQFKDLWCLQHPWDNPRGDWCVAGVQQLMA